MLAAVDGLESCFVTSFRMNICSDYCPVNFMYINIFHSLSQLFIGISIILCHNIVCHNIPHSVFQSLF